MRVPGFGNSANSYNSFIIIALLDDWKNRKKGQQVILREAIGKIVTLPQALAFQYLLSQLEYLITINQYKW